MTRDEMIDGIFYVRDGLSVIDIELEGASSILTIISEHQMGSDHALSRSATALAALIDKCRDGICKQDEALQALTAK